MRLKVAKLARSTVYMQRAQHSNEPHLPKSDELFRRASECWDGGKLQSAFRLFLSGAEIRVPSIISATSTMSGLV